MLNLETNLECFSDNTVHATVNVPVPVVFFLTSKHCHLLNATTCMYLSNTGKCPFRWSDFILNTLKEKASETLTSLSPSATPPPPTQGKKDYGVSVTGKIRLCACCDVMKSLSFAFCPLKHSDLVVFILL